METLSIKPQFDGLIFIGRFQPFHNGHLEVIRKASKLAEKVLIIIGSANAHQNVRNPFTYSQRVEMIGKTLIAENITNFTIAGQNDVPYNDQVWVKNLQATVSSIFSNNEKLGLIGHAKDESSYYLKLFPEFASVDCSGVNVNDKLLNATDIRNDFFGYTDPDIWSNVPFPVKAWLEEYSKTEEYKKLMEEFEFVAKYKKQWAAAPYPPIFVTVDAVVIQAGHILLVTRGAMPGKGKLAMPGGFLNQYERLEDAVIRELGEETCIDIPPAVLKSKAVKTQHFAYPYRSSRGRTITFATLFNLDDEITRRLNITAKGRATIRQGIGLTKVKGADDAAHAAWYKISDLKKSDLFEDHYDIIMTMLGDVS